MGSCRVGPPPAWHPHPAFHAWRPTSAAPPHRPRSYLMSRGRALNPRQRAIRHDRGDGDGVGAPAGRESCCFSLPEGLTRSVRWLPAPPGCTARGWGATGRELGVLRVGGAFVQ